jgi:hypothetical protein
VRASDFCFQGVGGGGVGDHSVEPSDGECASYDRAVQELVDIIFCH